MFVIKYISLANVNNVIVNVNHDMLDKSKYFHVGKIVLDFFRFNLDPLRKQKSNPFLYLRKGQLCEKLLLKQVETQKQAQVFEKSREFLKYQNT